MIDNMVPGISTVITGAMLRFIRSTISRKTSGAKVFSDRLNAIHGPLNIPAVRAEKTMLINCHVFIVSFHFTQRFRRRARVSFGIDFHFFGINC